VGSNTTLTIAACPGFSVTGTVIPVIVKPVPVSVAALTVTAAVPVDVKVTDCAAAADFTFILPNATVLELMCSVGTAALSCRAKVFATLPALAVSVATCAVRLDEAVAVNVVLVAFAGTVTVAGSVTAELLLAKPTLSPPLPAAAFRVTVQVSVPDPVIEVLVQLSAFNAADAEDVPVPLRLTAVEVPLRPLLLLVMVN
jgi:hypothetical protein